MQKLISVELYAERIPKDPGFLLREFPELQSLLGQGQRISCLSTANLNQNVYVLTLTLEPPLADSPLQRLIILERYAERIPKDPGYLLRENEPVRPVLEEGWLIKNLSSVYVNENVYGMAILLEKSP